MTNEWHRFISSLPGRQHIICVDNYIFLYAVLGVTVGLRHFLRCRTYQNGVFTITCPCNHVIRIESAEVGFGQPCLHSVECRKPITLTDYPSIMSCNGRRRCSFSKNVLNSYECGRRHNFINITYYCIGK